MARIRSIKPSFWTDPDVGRLRRDARLLTIGLISMADDEGRFLATATSIGGFVFPHDELPPKTVRLWRDEVAKAGVIEIYNIEGSEYGWSVRRRETRAWTATRLDLHASERSLRRTCRSRHRRHADYPVGCPHPHGRRQR